MDESIQNTKQLAALLSGNTLSPDMHNLIDTADHALVANENIEGLLGMIETQNAHRNIFFHEGESALEDPDQPVGEVPILEDPSSPSRPMQDIWVYVFQDLVLTVCLTHFLEKQRQNKQSYAKQIRDILSYISARQANLLLSAEPLLRIVADQKFAILERGRASRALVNNFNIEQVLIYAALDPKLTTPEKQYVFSWLTAFQKVYRRVESTIYDQKSEKVTAAKRWFCTTLTALRKNGQAPYDLCAVSGFIHQFVQAVAENNVQRAQDLGRALVLTTNNEDIIREMHDIFQNSDSSQYKDMQIKEIYKSIFEIMQDYRMICIQKRTAQVHIKERFSQISLQRREMEKVMGMEAKDVQSTPVLGIRREHALLEETKNNLAHYGLLHLFELWPIPKISQELFNQVCQLKNMIPQDAEHSLEFLLYIEKLLEFLMRLDRLGIKVIQHEALNVLLTNAYQIHTMHLLKEGMYLGSTGYWRTPNQRPPSVICITNPGAMGNCMNVPLRHINFRIFLGTGQFYESPFVLDSTERYGAMDEMGGPEQLFMRPGLFLLDIPDEIEMHFRKVQKKQLQTAHFQNLVQTRVRKG
jgi:hypothetical protein